jgi:hypothetical protein
MKKILYAFAFLITVVLAGCAKDAQSAEKVGDFNVEFLFSKDGCNVYRFMDGGRYVYWADCPGRVSSDYTSNKHQVHVESFTSL